MTEENIRISGLVRPLAEFEFRLRSALGIPIPAPAENLYNILTSIEGIEAKPLVYVEQHHARLPVKA